MATRVPAIERTHRILDLLARHPRETFSSAALASALGIHRATCFSILKSLAELGLVCRDPARKTYHLGPELIRFGAATAEHYEGIAEARKEMFFLSRELEIGCLVCIAMGSEMIVVDRAGGEGFGLPSVDSTRSPLVPPLGGIFVAWSSKEVIEQWVRRAPPHATADDLASYRRSVAAIRARGYSIGGDVEAELQLETKVGQLLKQLERTDRMDPFALRLEVADLIRTGSETINATSSNHEIRTVIGPVFDRRGDVLLTLTLRARPGQVIYDQVSDYAKPLLSSAGRVTAAIGGKLPGSPPGRP